MVDLKGLAAGLALIVVSWHNAGQDIRGRALTDLRSSPVDVAWLLVLVAYVAGSFPSATIVGDLVGHDPTREGSRNPGASNMYRIAGRNAGAIVLLADVLKGALPALLGLGVGSRALGVACGVAAVLGHIFPLTRKFRGGKGVATFGGLLLACWSLVGVICLVTWLVILRLTRTASIGALVCVPLSAVLIAALGSPAWEVIVLAALGALIVFRHRANISRLLNSEELNVSG